MKEKKTGKTENSVLYVLGLLIIGLILATEAFFCYIEYDYRQCVEKYNVSDCDDMFGF